MCPGLDMVLWDGEWNETFLARQLLWTFFVSYLKWGWRDIPNVNFYWHLWRYVIEALWLTACGEDEWWSWTELVCIIKSPFRILDGRLYVDAMMDYSSGATLTSYANWIDLSEWKLENLVRDWKFSEYFIS